MSFQTDAKNAFEAMHSWVSVAGDSFNKALTLADQADAALESGNDGLYITLMMQSAAEFRGTKQSIKAAYAAKMHMYECMLNGGVDVLRYMCEEVFSVIPDITEEDFQS